MQKEIHLQHNARHKVVNGLIRYLGWM